MSQIGVLTTGAGVVSAFTQPQCEQYLMIGDVDTTMPLTGISVDVEGQTIINVQGSTPLVSTLAKWLNQMTGSGIIGMVIPMALGKIFKNTNIRLTNAAATTPAIFAYSETVNPPIPFNASTIGIVASSQQTFREFSGLFLTPSANLGTVDVTWKNGNKNTYTAVELDALFASKNQTEANGRLDSVVTGIDNRNGEIDNVLVNATTAVTAMICKVPDASWEQAKAVANA